MGKFNEGEGELLDMGVGTATKMLTLRRVVGSGTGGVTMWLTSLQSASVTWEIKSLP